MKKKRIIILSVEIIVSVAIIVTIIVGFNIKRSSYSDIVITSTKYTGGGEYPGASITPSIASVKVTDQEDIETIKKYVMKIEANMSPSVSGLETPGTAFIGIKLNDFKKVEVYDTYCLYIDGDKCFKSKIPEGLSDWLNEKINNN